MNPWQQDDNTHLKIPHHTLELSLFHCNSTVILEKEIVKFTDAVLSFNLKTTTDHAHTWAYIGYTGTMRG